MKKNRIAQLIALLLCAMLVLATVGCKTADTTEAEETGTQVTGDVPSDRYDATVTPRTGNNATTPLVISSSTLDGKFSPFFATSAYDVTVEGYTQIGLLYLDKMGTVQAGVEYPSLAYSYSQEVSDDKSTSTYTFVLKNGITFSDGEPVTAKDVLFSIYTLCDPLYDGSSTFYSMDVQGLNEYRLQTSAEALAVADAIVSAGIYSAEDGSLAYPAADGATTEQQAAFWGYLDQAGEKFAQEIVDYCMNNYNSDDYVQAYFSPDLTFEDIKASDALTVAYGMGMWGFGLYADGIFTDALENTYDVATDSLTAADYWANIVGSYGYDISDGGINYEMAGETRIEDYVRDLYIANEGAVEGGVASISGITSGTTTGDDGVEREYIQIVINGIDPTAIFKMGIEVCPFHYYTEGFTGELNEYGVSLSDPAFIELLKSKNDAPMGAGPYVFVEYKDNVVYYTANDSYLMGSPKIEYLRIQEIAGGAEMDSVLTDVVHFTDPSASTTIINDITAAQGDYAKLAYTLVDNDGYGYIGINAQFFPDWNVRKAIASTFNTELCLDSYGELATLNYRTMTKIQWAYPENPENLFPYDETGETAKALFLEAGYIYDEAANVMYYPEGYVVPGMEEATTDATEDATEATDATEGETTEAVLTPVTIKATLPFAADDHPAGAVFINAQKVLEKIGIKLDIEIDESVLNKLSTAYESGVEVWAAAWGNGGQDPDMFQVWYSDPDVNQSTSPAAKGLFWLYENGSDDQVAALKQLNELIIAGRSTLDTEERKTIYAEALEISTSLACEIPTYQRKNMFVFNKDVIDADSLFSGDDVTPFQSPISFIWNVELVG